MTDEKRKAWRARCYVPASSPRGEAIFEDLSTLGGRLQTRFKVERGEPLPLQVHGRAGETAIDAVVVRVSAVPLGFRIGCRFTGDSSVRAAGRLFEEITAAAR